jgi:hypothetical protein
MDTCVRGVCLGRIGNWEGWALGRTATVAVLREALLTLFFATRILLGTKKALETRVAKDMAGVWWWCGWVRFKGRREGRSTMCVEVGERRKALQRVKTGLQSSRNPEKLTGLKTFRRFFLDFTFSNFSSHKGRRRESGSLWDA